MTGTELLHEVKVLELTEDDWKNNGMSRKEVRKSVMKNFGFIVKFMYGVFTKCNW